jgi:hypothetical protein
MLTADFQANGVIGRMRRSNKRLDEFDAAIYTRKLYQVYGDVQDDLASAYTVRESTDEKGGATVNIIPNAEMFMRPDIQAGLTIYNAIVAFAAVAPRITELHADDVEWTGPRGSAEKIDAVFRLWLSDEELQKAIEETGKLIDHPNGVLSGKLTEEQKKDPLSEPAAAITSSN